MTIVYNRETREVLFDGAKPLDYSKRAPVYRVMTNPETGEESRELLGYTMYVNTDVFATAEVQDNFREKFYRL